VKPSPVPPLFQPWFSGRPAAAYLLSGDGAGLADLVAELWMGRFLEEGATSELIRWTPADLERESPEAFFRTPSFFSRFRVFVLPDLAEVKKAPREAILAYLAAPEPSVVLVLPCSERNVARAVSAVSGVKTMAPREEQVVSALAGFAVAAARGAGKEFPSVAAEFLVRWVGLDYSRLKEEIGKLLSFAGDRTEIGEEEVKEICVAGGAVDPFVLAKKLEDRDMKGCLSMFRKFAAGAETADYHGLVGAIAWSVRKRLVARATTLSPERGGEILAALSRIDRGMKGESGLSPEQLFEIQLLKLLG
jgi:DNA polymerase III delta subunit